jgi:hypothetical protein
MKDAQSLGTILSVRYKTVQIVQQNIKTSKTIDNLLFIHMACNLRLGVGLAVRYGVRAASPSGVFVYSIKDQYA